MRRNTDLVAAVREQANVSREMAKDLSAVAGDVKQVRENVHKLRDDLATQLTSRDLATRQLQQSMGQVFEKLDTLLRHFERLSTDVLEGHRKHEARIRTLEGNTSETTGRHGTVQR